MPARAEEHGPADSCIKMRASARSYIICDSGRKDADCRGLVLGDDGHGAEQLPEFGLVADRVEVVIVGDDLQPGRVLPQGGGQEAERFAAVVGLLPGGQGVDAGDLVEGERAVVEGQAAWASRRAASRRPRRARRTPRPARAFT